MSKQPIMKFKSDAELQACLAWWQERLGLRDWTIKAKITDELTCPTFLGENEYLPTNKCALIRIRPFDTFRNDWVAKQLQELVLVHELLHCKIFQISPDKETIEMVVFNQLQHQLIEDMAKALIMAKYGWTLDDFKN